MMISIYSILFLIIAVNGVSFKFAQPPPGDDTVYCVKIECSTYSDTDTRYNILHHSIHVYANVHKGYADLEAYNCPNRKYNLTISTQQTGPRFIHDSLEWFNRASFTFLYYYFFNIDFIFF